MKETFQLELMLSQLSDLYSQILDGQNKKLSVSPETLEDIRRLTKIIEEISKLTDQELANRGISSETIKLMILGPKSNMPIDIQSLLEKSQYLKSQLEGCRNVLKEVIKKQKEAKKAGKRKDKFKNIGGTKGWIPM